MTIARVNKVGRPKAKQTKTCAQRVQAHRLRNIESGRVERKFILDAHTDELFNQLRVAAGFSHKEKSDFLTALLLKVANKNWFGKDFQLPIESVPNHKGE